MDDVKKPLPVKIVEAIAWTYVALVVLGCVVGICLSGDPSLFIAAFFPLALTLGMILSLRRGSRAWFVVPNTIVTLLCLFGSAVVLCESISAVALFLGLVALLLFVVPLVLLYMPTSTRWFKAKAENGRPDSLGCLGVFLLALLFVVGGSIFPSIICYSRVGRINVQSQMMAMRGRNLYVLMMQDYQEHESGEDWIDPASFTNSTQYVQTLWAKFSDGKGSCPCPDSWCVAVNSPDNGKFPVMVTANIDPRELLQPSGEGQPLKLTCPKEWGGVCFKFCEKMGVVHYKNGVSQIVKKHMSPKEIFCSGIPKPGPETYFLTPAGRVDFVERQAADWLSIHEFASNEDSGDVSVKWRVAWPESLSGLSNEGLSSVRREILQMTFGPAWSDLNHGDKTWVPPPTIEEAEEEIKRKLEEPDIVWEFSGDVELDRPFGASLQDGAEWYARPVIVAKNDGNSSFRRECGCTYYTIARTFSIPDGREMTVDDYFDRGKMKELSALVWRRLLESVFPFDDETRKGMGHRDINLRDRNLIFIRVMSGGICFYFAPYSIFSGAEGVTKAFLKWGELSKFRKK